MVGAAGQSLIIQAKTQGDIGYLGENGSLDIYAVESDNLEKNSLYPITVKNSQIGNIYFQLERIEGTLGFTYEDNWCATSKYEDPVCGLKSLNGKEAGDTYVIDNKEYILKNKLKLATVTYKITAYVKMKQGYQRKRVFRDEIIKLDGVYEFNGKYNTDLIYNPELLSRD